MLWRLLCDAAWKDAANVVIWHYFGALCLWERRCNAATSADAVSITAYDAAAGVLWYSERHCQRPLKDENALNFFYNLFANVDEPCVGN